MDVSKHLMLDNSNPKENIIHFMLPKDKLVSLVEQAENKSGSSGELMTFSLRPSMGMSGITTNMTLTEACLRSAGEFLN